LSRLITAIILRNPKRDPSEFIGNIYLVKFLDKLEDARELSAMINACSRLDMPQLALSLCLGNRKARKKAEQLYARYKQEIVSALNFVQNEAERIEGKDYVIIHARDKIKDTIVGTIASILSNSAIFEDGKIIVTMAYREDKLKVSARIAGRNGEKNLQKLMCIAAEKLEAECGGHALAAGCLVPREKESEFLENLKKALEIELIKV